jgi:hypothetical protein
LIFQKECEYDALFQDYSALKSIYFSLEKDQQTIMNELKSIFSFNILKADKSAEEMMFEKLEKKMKELQAIDSYICACRKLIKDS